MNNKMKCNSQWSIGKNNWSLVLYLQINGFKLNIVDEWTPY